MHCHFVYSILSFFFSAFRDFKYNFIFIFEFSSLFSFRLGTILTEFYSRDIFTVDKIQQSEGDRRCTQRDAVHLEVWASVLSCR